MSTKNFLSPVVCRDLIERFEKSPHAGRSPTSSDTGSSSDGPELPLDSQPGWGDARQVLNDAALRGLRNYLRRYGHAALGPLRFQMPHPITSALVTLNARGIVALDDETLNSLIVQLFRPGGIHVRRHRGDAGGDPYWRQELYPNPSLDDGGFRRAKPSFCIRPGRSGEDRIAPHRTDGVHTHLSSEDAEGS